MRKSLFAAAAVAPLALLAGRSAVAATSINDSRTQPVATATANSGQPDDVTIGTGGSVKLSGSAGPAVTLNSNNTLTNNGGITIDGVDNATGVLIEGGHTGGFSNAGSIGLGEDYTAEDTNKDGVPDGPYAKGTGRYGLRATGASSFVGDVVNTASGSIQVKGNNSFGVSIEAPVQGKLESDGLVTVLGDDSVGLRETSGVSGKVLLQGTVSATGGNSQAVSLTGDIGGSLGVYGVVQATGYRVLQRSSDPAVNASLKPENLLQSGSALTIGADVAGGVFLGAPPPGTDPTDTKTDADHDGIVDSQEGTSTVAVFGSAPALAIGAAGRDVHLGAFGADANAYGLIVEGKVTGAGVFDNRSAAAIQIGTGDGTVHVDGGLRNVGAVSASAFEADATGVRIRSGATVPAIRNEGGLGANVTSALASSATAVTIESGASVTSLDNSGTISATLAGDLGSAYAVVDRSGQLSSVTNSNTIQAVVTPAASTSAALGRSVALDLSRNTSGVSLSQVANADSKIKPYIFGDVLLGSGNDTVKIQAGDLVGALDFGAGAGSLLIDGGANYRGALTASGPLAIDVSNGVLEDRSPTTIAASSLTVGDKGVLTFAADPAHNAATRIDVSGAASIADGGRLGLYLTSLPTGPSSYTVLTASSLSVGSSTGDLTASAPYLFVASFTPDAGAGTITLNLRRRTAQEANLNASEAATLDPIYNAIAKDSGIQRAFLSQNDRAGLVGMLNQMMPDHAGGVFRALSWAAERQGDAAGEPPLGQDQAGPTRAWTNEIVLSENKDAGSAPGYHIFGFGAQGGVESVSAKGDAIGARVAFTTSNIHNPDVASDNLLGVSQISGGVYWRGRFGGLRADAQLGAGFIWANSRREFLFSDTVGVVHRMARANWTGYSLNGRLGLAYRADFGRAFLEPKVHLDYFRAHEGGYTETGGGDGFDLAVDPRTGDLLSVTGGLTAGLEWGTGFRFRPQVEVGYRDVLTGSAGATRAVLASGGDPFTLAAESIKGGVFTGQVGFRVYSDYLDLLLAAGAEVGDQYTDLEANLTARTVF